MTDTRIPDLEFVTPECSLCGFPTKSRDGGFTCDRCKFEWSFEGCHGERYDGSPECGEEYSPGWEKTRQYHCIRGAGHALSHYGVRVDEPDLRHEVQSWPKGESR